MGERISNHEVEVINALIDRDKLPNTFDYLLLHGVKSAMSPYNLTGKYKTTEEIYGECLKRKIKWEELIKLPEEDVLL
jgi:hypothetical protein